MANIIITKTGTRVDVDFGHYWRGSATPYANANVNAEKSSYQSTNVQEVWKENDRVFVRMDNMRDWSLGVTQGADNLVIDSVDGVVPTDTAHLFTLIKGLM